MSPGFGDRLSPGFGGKIRLGGGPDRQHSPDSTPVGRHTGPGRQDGVGGRIRRIGVRQHGLPVPLELLADLDQQGADPLQPLHQFDVAAHPLAGALSAHRTLGTLQRHAALLDQVVDLLEVLHVLRRKEPVALLVALGPQDGKLRLPVAEQRLIDVEHLGHLAHRIV